MTLAGVVSTVTVAVDPATEASVSNGAPSAIYDVRPSCDVVLEASAPMDGIITLTAQITVDNPGSYVVELEYAPGSMSLTGGLVEQTVHIERERELSWGLVVSGEDAAPVRCTVATADGQMLGHARLFLSSSGVDASTDVISGPALLDVTNAAAIPSSPSAVPLDLSWTFSYTDHSGLGSTPCPDALVELWQPALVGHTVVMSARTDANGLVSFHSVSSGEYAACIYADDGFSVRVSTGGLYGSVYSWWTGYDTYTSSESRAVFCNDATRGAWEAYGAVQEEHDWLFERTSWSRSEITVYWPLEDWPHSNGNEIHIPADDGVYDWIWDRSTLIHEYGHCIHYALRGGSFPPGSGGDHYIYSETNQGFALTEGWAEFMECAVQNDSQAATWQFDFETAMIADYLDNTDWDGAIVEGAVASAFWDILDGTSATDYPSFDASHTGDLVDSQFTTLWGAMATNPDTIDQLWAELPQTTAYWAVFYHQRINYDSTAPEAPTGYEADHEPGVWMRSTYVNLSLVGGSDDLSGIMGYWFCWSWTPYDPSGIAWSDDAVFNVSSLEDGHDWYFNFRAVDRAGNLESGYSYITEPWKIDLAPPHTDYILEGTLGGDGWFITPPTMSPNASDPESGVASSYYRINSGPWTPWTPALMIAQQGILTFEYYSVDNVGNVEEHHFRSLSMDFSGPIIEVDVQGDFDGVWFSSIVNASLTAYDPISGLDASYTRLDLGPWHLAPPFVLMGNGIHTLEFYAVDNAGVQSMVYSHEFKIDLLAQNSTALLAGTEGGGGWYRGAITVSLSADSGLSGLKQINYSLDIGPWSVYGAPFDVFQQGQHTLRFRSVDKAGNVESVRTVVMKVDSQAPVVELQISGTESKNSWFVMPIVCAFRVNDLDSGVADLECTLDGNALPNPTGEFEIATEGVHNVTYTTIDTAGNPTGVIAFPVKLDLSAPTFSFNWQPGAKVESLPLMLNLTVSDSASGIDFVRMSIDGGAPFLVDAPYSASIASLSDGTHNISVYVEDLAGHSTARSMIVTVSTSTASGSLDPIVLVGVGAVVIVAALAAVLVLRRRR